MTDDHKKHCSANQLTKAQRLSDQLEDESGGVVLGFIPGQPVQEKELDCNFEAAAELRRLDALVGELVEALDRLVRRDDADGVAYTGDHPIAQAKAALAKAKEQT